MADTYTNSEVAILATAFVTLITTIATLLYQFVSAGRRHSWEVDAVRRHAETATKAESERQQIAARVDKAEATLNAKIDENTAISRAAFSEANHMNEKLATQAKAFDRLLEVALTSTPALTVIDDVRATITDTAEKVTDINEKTTEIRDRVIRDG